MGWCWFLRDVQKDATLPNVAVPLSCIDILAGVQGAAGPPDGVNEGVSHSALINSPSRKGRGKGMVGTQIMSCGGIK